MNIPVQPRQRGVKNVPDNERLTMTMVGYGNRYPTTSKGWLVRIMVMTKVVAVFAYNKS
jgi:hypothetical protein